MEKIGSLGTSRRKTLVTKFTTIVRISLIPSAIQGKYYMNWFNFKNLDDNAQRDVRQHLILGAVTLAYVLTAFAFSRMVDAPQLFRISLYSKVLLYAGSVGAFVVGYVHLFRFMVRNKDADLPLTLLVQTMKDNRPSLLSLSLFVGIIFGWQFFTSAYTSIKSLISLVHPFSYDEAFYRIDRAMHFGVDPWRITHGVLSNHWATFFIDWTYKVWFLVMYGFNIWNLFRLNEPDRRFQFFLSYFLIWLVGGSVMAIFLSSAGPCYYQDIVGVPAYAELFTRLADQQVSLTAQWDAGKIFALEGQGILWEQYAKGAASFGSGISAMPSMHVAIVTLMALSAFEAHRIFGLIMTAYAACILIGSVHLGWHYAIDGYLSIVLTIALWRFSRWVVTQT